MPRIQLKIMASLTALVVVVTVTSGVLAERSLRQREMERIESSMRERALLLSQIVANLPDEAVGIDRDRVVGHRRGEATLVAAGGLALFRPDRGSRTEWHEGCSVRTDNDSRSRGRTPW